MRVLTTAAATAALTVALATSASAHAELSPYRLPPGAEATLALVVTHGCADEAERFRSDGEDEPPTTAIDLQVPLELTVVPQEVDGWTLTTEAAAGRVTRARWESEDPAGTTESVRFPLDVTVADVPDGTVVWLPLVQDCAGGASLAWTLEGDVRGGDDIPAMRLFVDEDAPVPSDPDDAGATADGATAGGSADTSTPDRALVGSVALAVVGLGGVALAIRRRRSAGR